MFPKVLFIHVLLLCVLETISLSIQFEEEHSNKGLLEINGKLMNNYYNFDWDSDDNSHESEENTEGEESSFDSWSLVWYIASFGGLIAFFLVVSCSEWCCRKHVREQQSRRGLASPLPSPTTESPPPAYDLFAPPSYESLNSAGSSEKSEYDIYVVPVHAIDSLVDENNARQREDPPSYNSINEQQTNNQRATDT